MGFPRLSCSLKAFGKRGLGLFLILVTAVIWVAASFLSELLVSTKPGETSLHVPPLLLTYLATSVFTFFLPIAYIRSWWQERWGQKRAVRYQRLDSITTDAADEDDEQSKEDGMGRQTSLERDLEQAEAAAQALASAGDRKAAEREAMVAAAQCSALWFLAQYLFNVSLAWTSVTSNTILSSSSSLFTFGLSMIFLKEGYSTAKLLSILLCIGGTALVTFSDHDAGSKSGGSKEGGQDMSTAGDLLCLLSAMCYGSYVVVMRRALPDEEEANVALFFGFVGLFCTVALAPLIIGLVALGVMDLKAIPAEAYGIIAIEGVLNYAFSDYLWAHAVLLLGPTIATLGLSVQIPIAALAEATWGHPTWLATPLTRAMTAGGTLLIMMGFFWGNLAGGGQVPGSHHRHEDNGVARRYLAAGDEEEDADDWNTAFDMEEDDDAEGGFGGAQYAIPVSTSASIRGRPATLPGRGGGSEGGPSPRAQPATLRGSGQQQEQQEQQQQQQQRRQSIELSVTSSASVSPAARAPDGPSSDKSSSRSSSGSGSPKGLGDSGGGGSSSRDGTAAAAANAEEGSSGGGGVVTKVHRVSRLARASSYLDAA